MSDKRIQRGIDINPGLDGWLVRLDYFDYANNLPHQTWAFSRLWRAEYFIRLYDSGVSINEAWSQAHLWSLRMKDIQEADSE